jgi:hypothetical protein
MRERETILAMLSPLMERARKEGLWFHCGYQDMWFAPDELQKRWDRGELIWGPVNWELRDPKVLLEQAKESVYSAVRRRDELEKRLSRQDEHE